MAKIDEYRQKLNEQASANAQNGSNSTSGSSTTDTYQMARNQEYSALLDKEVQLENAKQNAMKYTNNQLASQGLTGTGYGSTSKSAIYGQYMNALGNAQNTAQSNISDINLQEAQANEEDADDRFQSITTMMSGATSTEQMNSMLKDYGYMDEDGNWLSEKPDSVSDDDWYQMKYYYNLYKDSLDGSSTIPTAVSKVIGDNVSSSYDLSSLANIKVGMYDDKALSDEYGREYNKLSVLIQNSQLNENGTMIKMSREAQNDADSKYLYYYKGKFYIVNQGKYDSYSGSKWAIRGRNANDMTQSSSN